MSYVSSQCDSEERHRCTALACKVSPSLICFNLQTSGVKANLDLRMKLAVKYRSSVCQCLRVYCMSAEAGDIDQLCVWCVISYWLSKCDQQTPSQSHVPVRHPWPLRIGLQTAVKCSCMLSSADACACLCSLCLVCRNTSTNSAKHSLQTLLIEWLKITACAA